MAHTSATVEKVVPSKPTAGKPVTGPAGTSAPVAKSKEALEKEALEGVIRVRAYEKWVKTGRPSGNGISFWLEAEREILEAR